jgi:hypothetical protein
MRLRHEHGERHSRLPVMTHGDFEMSGTQRYAALAVFIALTPSSGVIAAGPAHEHVDTRFSHDRTYFDRGYTVHEVPSNGYAIDRDGAHYWYDKGEWYRKEGADWIVVAAPLGALVSVLPPSYTRVMLDDVTYYYANDTYYQWNGGQQKYQVVAPPAGIDSAGSAQPAPDGQLFVYRKEGVSLQQQANDRYECDGAAVTETGYDPTQEDGGVPVEIESAKRADYFRAEAACLAVRGYTVR